MAEAKHHAGGIVSVYADEDGHPRCLACGEPLTTDQMTILIRMPYEPAWYALCPACRRELAVAAMAGMAEGQSPLKVLLI